MTDKKNTHNDKKDIDFTSNSSFKKVVRKAKWKQYLIYTLISIVTLIVCGIVTHLGSEYLTGKKIEKEQEKHSGEKMSRSIITSSMTFQHNLFSVTGKRTYYKTIGGREIVWDWETKKFPAIGDNEVIDRGSGFIEVSKFNEEFNRAVRYNNYNNERLVHFYYPGIDYEYLPQELDIAIGLDKNTLVEVALSFNEPKREKELGNTLGYKNVDFLWKDQTTKESRESIEKKWENDGMKVKPGEKAVGSQVDENYPYDEIGSQNEKFSGAIVSGTPKELQRFKDLKFVRASIIGATIDKY